MINKQNLAQNLNESPVSTKSAQVTSSPFKNFSFSGFLRYLKQLQDKFLLKTSRTVEDKVQMLENLQDRIANQIRKLRLRINDQR